MFTIEEFHEAGHCDNCEKDADVFCVQCSAGTLVAKFCAKCLAKQCRLRAKSKVAPVGTAATGPSEEN